MNDWKRESVYTKWYYVFGYSIPILTIFSFVTNEWVLFSLTLLLFLVFTINNMYLSYISKRITIPHKKVIRKLFPNEQTTIPIPFINRGSIPIFHVKISCHFHISDDSMKIMKVNNEKEGHLFYQTTSFPQRTTREIEIPIQSLKRGIGEIRTIYVDIYDLFHLKHVQLRYEGSYRGEAIVYPTLMKVDELNQFFQQEIGEQIQSFSMYEDMLIRGSREYTTSDPFNRIHWKASARSNEIQTKVFERINISRWTFIVNVRSEKYRTLLIPTIPNLEEVLSQVAYACEFATLKQISFEMYINLLVPGSKKGLYLPLNSGEAHLRNALELLARIKKSTFTIRTENMVQSVISSTQANTIFILHFGPCNESERNMYHSLQQNGGKVIYIQS